MISQVSVSNMIINSCCEYHFSRRVAAFGDLKHVEMIALVWGLFGITVRTAFEENIFFLNMVVVKY